MVNIFYLTATKEADRILPFEYNGYWKDVGTLGSYWESNMELIDLIPVFNLYEEFWKIYTSNEWDSSTVYCRRCCDWTKPLWVTAVRFMEKSIVL